MGDLKSKKQAEQSKIEEARKERNRAYVAVFGVEGKRTKAQQIVMQDIRGGCFADKTTLVVNGQGNLDPIRAAANEGRRSFYLEIEEFIRAGTSALSE